MKADHNELCEERSMYVLGGLNPEEREAFEEHLRHCPVCQKEVLEMQELVQYLPLATEEVKPPEGMKSRILAHVLQSSEVPQQETSETVSPRSAAKEESPPASAILKERTEGHHDRHVVLSEDRGAEPDPEPQRRQRQRRSRWSAVLSVASVVLLIAASVLAVRVNDLNGDKSTLLAEVAKLQGELVASNEPVTGLQVHNVVSLKPTIKDLVAQGKAMIVIDSKGTHLIVQAEKLPELKGDEAFQVWLLKGGKPVNAGTFITQNGTGALYYTFSPDEYDTIAITQEPDANGKEPRGNIVLAAEI